jgi:hypothetical protein
MISSQDALSPATPGSVHRAGKPAHRSPGRLPPQDPHIARLAGEGRQPAARPAAARSRGGGRTWWALGFEATGPASLLRSEPEAAAAHVFTRAPPGGMELGTDDSQSYAQWLTHRPGARRHRRLTAVPADGLP